MRPPPTSSRDDRAHRATPAPGRRRGRCTSSAAEDGRLLTALAAAKPGGAILELGTGTGLGTASLLAGIPSAWTTAAASWCAPAPAESVQRGDADGVAVGVRDSEGAAVDLVVRFLRDGDALGCPGGEDLARGHLERHVARGEHDRLDLEQVAVEVRRPLDVGDVNDEKVRCGHSR